MGSSGTASAAVSACTRSSSRSPTSRSSSRRCSTASSRAWTSAAARAAAPSWSARKVNARIELGARVLGIDLSHPVSVAVALDFRGSQPRHFGAPRASSRPFEAPGFLGSVERGASCNCETLTLIPHCNGTHTECVGHLTREPLPSLTQQAAQLLVRRGIWHLIVDVPSIDRAHDEGRLTAHRIFFGLPRRSVELAAAARPEATVTELAYMADELADGAYLVELQ